MNKSAARPIWPKVRPSFVKEVLAGHSALGLAAGALIYLVCLTGTLVVFVADLRAWEQPQAPRHEAVSAQTIDRAVAHALSAPGEAASTIYVMMPRMVDGRLTVATYGKDERTEWVGPNGDSFGVLETPWSDFADHLHMYLTLPGSVGLIAVGLVGIMLLALLISGVLAHPRIFRDAFTLRIGGSKRIQEADLHNRLSVWGLPFHLVVTLTGTFFGVSSLFVMALAAAAYHGDVVKVYAPLTGPASKSAASSTPPMASLFAQLKISDPASQVNYVGFEQPGKAGQRITIEVAAPDRLPRGERWFFDGAGRLIGQDGSTNGSAGAQTYAAAATLHFGSFGGWPVRVLYGVLGLALTAITASGLSIWMARRRDAGRPVQRLESAWLAWVWGTPSILVLTALVAQFTPVSPTAVFWGAALGLIPAAVLVNRPAVISSLGQTALGLGLIVLAAVHQVRFGAPGSAPELAVQLFCLSLGVGLLGWQALRLSREQRRPATAT